MVRYFAMQLSAPNLDSLFQSPTRALTFPRAQFHTHKLTHPRALALIQTRTLANARNGKARAYNHPPTHSRTNSRTNSRKRTQ